MKKIFIILSIILASCSQDAYKGYIVCKKYTPEHMCCDKETTYIEAGFTYIPHATIHTHHHTLQEASYELYVANADASNCVTVSKKTFDDFKVLDKVQVSNAGIMLLSRR
jgi:hypothetical protein